MKEGYRIRILMLVASLILLFAAASGFAFAESQFYSNLRKPRINVTFSEPVTVEKVLFDGDPNIAVELVHNTADTFFIYSPAESLAEGFHNFSITVRDSLGNFNSFYANFTLDYTSPVFLDTFPDDSEILFNSQPVFNITTDEDISTIYMEMGRKAYPLTTRDGRLYSTFPGSVSFLDDGYFSSYFFIADLAGNLKEKAVSFRVVTEKLFMELVNPRFGLSNKQRVNVIVETNREASCDYSLSSFDSGQMPFGHDTVSHELELTLDAELYVTCWDEFGYRITEHYSLKYDGEAPIIEAGLNPDVVTEKTTGLYTDPVYVAEAEASSVNQVADPVVCRYTLMGKPFSDMIKFDGYNEDIYSAYGLTKFQQITKDDDGNFLENNRVYTVNIGCMDLAGNIGYDSARLEIAEPAGPDVVINYPRNNRYVPTTSPKLNASTNMKAEACIYSANEQMSPSSYFVNSGGYSHIATLSGLSDGSAYTYYVECTFKASEGTKKVKKSTSFTVDSSPPKMIEASLFDSYLNSTQFTYHTDRLTGKWRAEDNQSGIDEYRISVYLKEFTGNKLLKELATSNSGMEITGLSLEDKKTYYIKAKSVNNAGIWSTEMQSNDITVDKSLEPEVPAHCLNGIKDSGKETDVDCGGECPDCGLNKTCQSNSDCISGYCNSAKKCDTPSCDDGIWNGDEADTDCGRNCPDKCENGDSCSSNSDCRSGICESSVCVAEDQCENGAMDAGETDIDCGGICIFRVPPKLCPIGKHCEDDSDCQDGSRCLDSVCSSCDSNDFNCDGELNDFSQDIDGDGLMNWEDPDDDNDGLCDTLISPLNDDTCTGEDDDDDGDGIIDSEDKDTKQDWCYVESEKAAYLGKCSELGKNGIDVTAGDLDNDGTPNFLDDDIDGDGLMNWEDPDDDNDGLCDTIDSPLNDDSCSGDDEDDNNDGTKDSSEVDYDNDLDNDGTINELDDDMDGDGIPNSEDFDNDNDGLDDSIDSDDDNDGREDLIEDNDSDGMPDYWESRYGLDPLDPADASEDMDSDGLSNLEEYERGTDPGSEDTDGDGYSDKKEVDKGTDPLDPEDHPTFPWLLIIILLIILIILGIVGYYLYSEYSEYGSFDHMKQVWRERWERLKQKLIALLAAIGINIKGKGPQQPDQQPRQTPSAMPRQSFRPGGQFRPQQRPFRQQPRQPAQLPRGYQGLLAKRKKRFEILDKFSKDENQAPQVKPAQSEASEEASGMEKEVAKSQDSGREEDEKAIPVKEWETLEELRDTLDKSGRKRKIKSMIKSNAEMQRVHEIFNRLSRLGKEKIGSEAADDALSALFEASNRDPTKASMENLKHVLTRPRADKGKVSDLMVHLSRGNKMEPEDHAKILSGLVQSRKISKVAAHDVVDTLKKRKALSKTESEQIHDRLGGVKDGSARKR